MGKRFLRPGGARDIGVVDHPLAEDGSVRFHDTGAPPPEAMERIVRRVRERAMRWLQKHGFIDPRPVEERSNESPDGDAIDACADVALGGGTVRKILEHLGVPASVPPVPRARDPAADGGSEREGAAPEGD